MKKPLIIGIAVAAVLAVGGGVTAYTWQKGVQTRSYAEQVSLIMKDSNSKWTWEKLDIKTENKTPDEMQTEIMVVKTDSENQLYQLNALKAPRKAKALEAKMKEYFTMARDTAAKMITWTEYGKIWMEIGSSFQSMGNSKANTPAEAIAVFDKMHNTLTESLGKLNKTNPPEIYKDVHIQMIQMLEKFDQILVQMTDAIRKNDMKALTKLGSDIQAAGNEFSKLKMPEDSEVVTSIVTEDVKNKLKNYPFEIKAEVDELMKTGFSF
ncbi:MAG: hypothetical protein WC650_00755 [Candidatus Doudnabacteria bacterium]